MKGSIGLTIIRMKVLANRSGGGASNHRSDNTPMSVGYLLPNNAPNIVNCEMAGRELGLDCVRDVMLTGITREKSDPIRKMER